MTQVNASMTFDTRRMEESITAAVLAQLGQTVAEVVLPGIAQVAADVQRLTKLLEAEAVEPAEFAAVLAHSGAISIEVAQAQAAALTRLGYRLVTGVAPSTPEPVAATWAGPTPPQAAPAVRVPTGEVPLWSPPPIPESPAVQLGRDLDAIIAPHLDEIKRQNSDVAVPDKTWTREFE